MRIAPGLFSVTLAVAFGASAAAQTRELAVPRTAERPVIDGVLDDAAWTKAATLGDWVQTTPADNGTPHGATTAYLTYDRDAIYLAIRAKDEPGKIRYRLHERDNVMMQSQDFIAISIDPTNVRQRAFLLTVNPIGIQGDGLVVEGAGFEEWDATYDAAGKASVAEYIIEIAIPFKSLRYPSQSTQRWGFSLTRFYGRDGAKDTPWPQNRDLGCELCQMITLTGIEDIGGSTSFEFNPSVVGRANASRPDIGLPFEAGRASGEVGANLKYGITPNLTLDGTLNPDFSQIEADAGQIEINNRFALFFPEKRPFFLEGNDIFLTRFPMPGQDAGFYTPPVNIFYSRRIVDPDVGVKLTGKSGRLTVGLLGSLDAARDYALDQDIGGLSARTLDPFPGGDARAGVARIKLDVLKDGYVGAALTARRFGDGYGLVGAIDSRLRFSSNTTLRLAAARSRTEEPDVYGRIRRTLGRTLTDPAALDRALDSLPDDARSLNHESRVGTSVQGSFEFDDRHWNAGIGLVDITPEFETHLGFTPRTNYALFSGYVSYLRQGVGFIRQVRPQVRFEQGYEHDASGRIGSLGRRTDRLVSSYVDFTLPAASTFSVGVTRAFYRVDGIDFDQLDRMFIYFGSEGLRQLGWTVFFRAGEELIYNNVVDDGPASPSFFMSGSLNATFRPFPALRINLDLNGVRVWRRTATNTRDNVYAESAIPRVRGQFQLSQRLGLRVIGEYRFERFFRPSGALDQKRNVFRTDALVTYLIHPGQSIQIGWSTVANGDLDLPLRTVARGGVAKVTYLWRF